MTFQRNIYSTLCLAQKNKIQTSLHMSFIVFPHPREMRCWNKLMKYASCLHKATLIIYPFCWPSSRKFPQAKWTLLRTLIPTPKPDNIAFVSQSIISSNTVLFRVFPTKKGLRDPWEGQGEGLVGSIPGPTFLLQPKAPFSFQTKSLFPDLSSCSIYWYIFNK